jgi:hypothetical protein
VIKIKPYEKKNKVVKLHRSIRYLTQIIIIIIIITITIIVIVIIIIIILNCSLFLF